MEIIKDYLIQPSDLELVRGLIDDRVGLLDGVENQLVRRRHFADAFSAGGAVAKVATLVELSKHDQTSFLSLPVALLLPRLLYLGQSYYDRREAVDLTWKMRMATAELVRTRGADMLTVEGWDKKRVESFANTGLSSILAQEWSTQPSNLGWEAGLIVGGLLAVNWFKEFGTALAVFGTSTLMKNLATKSYLNLSSRWHNLSKDLSTSIYKRKGMGVSIAPAKQEIKHLAEGYSKNSLWFNVVNSLMTVGLPSVLTVFDPSRIASYLFLGNLANGLSDTFTGLKTSSADLAPDLRDVREMLDHVSKYSSSIATPADWAKICEVNRLRPENYEGKIVDGLTWDEDYTDFDPFPITNGEHGVVIGDFEGIIGSNGDKKGLRVSINGPIFLQSKKIHRVIGETGGGKSVLMGMLSMNTKFDKGQMYVRMPHGKDIFHMTYEDMRKTIGYYSAWQSEILKRPMDDFGVQMLVSHGNISSYWKYCENTGVQPNPLVQDFLYTIERTDFDIPKDLVQREIYWRFFGGRGKVKEVDTNEWVDKFAKRKQNKASVKEALEQVDPFLEYLCTERLIGSELFREKDAKRISSTPYDMLSPGERARLQLMRALHDRPDIMIIDEVFGNVDLTMRVKIANRIKDYVASGRIVVVVTHQEDDSWAKLIGEYNGQTLKVEDNVMRLIS